LMKSPRAAQGSLFHKNAKATAAPADEAPAREDAADTDSADESAEEEPPTEGKSKKKKVREERDESAAQRMASKQREISVSEFFTKNRHLLGFDSPRKALLTAVKEAVDNSLDACEEARIRPELRIEIRKMERENTFTVCIEDNGPGIVPQQIPN